MKAVARASFKRWASASCKPSHCSRRLPEWRRARKRYLKTNFPHPEATGIWPETRPSRSPELPRPFRKKNPMGLGRGLQNRGSGLWRHDQPQPSFESAGFRRIPYRIEDQALKRARLGGWSERTGSLSPAQGRMLVSSTLPSSKTYWTRALECTKKRCCASRDEKSPFGHGDLPFSPKGELLR